MLAVQVTMIAIRIARIVSLALPLSAVGCTQEIEAAKQAAAAAAALADAAKKAEAAGDAAAQAAKDGIPPGTDAKAAEQQVEMAKAIGAMQGMGQAMGTGPVVNWRQLTPFLPDAIGEFAAKDKLDGKTTKMGGMEVTHVERDYKSGERSLDVEITDAHLAMMLKLPFQMAATIQEDSSDGFKKGTKIDGHTAIVEWDESSKRSKAVVLVGDRFVLDVVVRPAISPEEAQALVQKLSLGDLAKVVPETAG